MVPKQMKIIQPVATAAMLRKWPWSAPKLDKILEVVAEFDAVKTRMTHLEEENK